MFGDEQCDNDENCIFVGQRRQSSSSYFCSENVWFFLFSYGFKAVLLDLLWSNPYHSVVTSTGLINVKLRWSKTLIGYCTCNTVFHHSFMWPHYSADLNKDFDSKIFILNWSPVTGPTNSQNKGVANFSIVSPISIFYFGVCPFTICSIIDEITSFTNSD